ncbi:MAG: DNA recombination protein RmuC [Oscillospiraceae bacterium]|jgi:DNA recombination protein RmuC|nr:DNA recombination protein RmuC [Oscillospiraceae bacterium]
MEVLVVLLSSLSLVASLIVLILLSRQKSLAEPVERAEKRLLDAMARSELLQEQKLEQIRVATERRLLAMQESTAKQFDSIRGVVEEKLQKTLDSRISQSFSLVNERLEQVYKGLGEMQALAVGVGDLKKVLSGVKTRGILGEVQLGAILDQILSPEQYGVNIATVPGSRLPVEYAVKMPGSGEESVWLPIDSKFPADRYAALCDAYDAGSPAAVESASRTLRDALRHMAKEIREKYIQPPYTTDFGILFLPFEGLYAEAVRRGFSEELQRDYRITVAGPVTMGALLNSLQMGFRTLAIQRRSGEVWKLLGSVKGEFEKFADVLDKAKKKLEAAGTDLDTLVGVRTRGILRSLSSVETPGLPEE